MATKTKVFRGRQNKDVFMTPFAESQAYWIWPFKSLSERRNSTTHISVYAPHTSFMYGLIQRNNLYKSISQHLQDSLKSVLASADSTGRFYWGIVSMDTIPSSSLTELHMYWKLKVIYSHFSHSNTTWLILCQVLFIFFRVLLKNMFFTEAFSSRLINS